MRTPVKKRMKGKIKMKLIKKTKDVTSEENNKIEEENKNFMVSFWALLFLYQD